MASRVTLFVSRQTTSQLRQGHALRRLVSSKAQARNMTLPSYLVTPKELHDAMSADDKKHPSVIPLCGSWFLPNNPDKLTGLQTYLLERIPGARFFDLEAVKDDSSPYPHMLPSGTQFAEAMGRLGIKNTDTVVVYDAKELGLFSAPRVSWTLKVLGHENVHVLNNFKSWIQQGYPVETGEPQPVVETNYEVKVKDKPQTVVDFEDVKKWAQGEFPADHKLAQAVLIDARPRGRWAGTSDEPRPGLSSGHIPGSISIPFAEVLDPTTKTLLPATRLKAIFEDYGVDPKATIITSCGTGTTAALLDAALEEAGYGVESADGQGGRYLYDGSWTEWAQRVTPEEKLIAKGHD